MNNILTNLQTAAPLPARKARIDLAAALAVIGLVLWVLLF
jgi:hypothetical protein